MKVAIDALGISLPGGGRTVILSLLHSMFKIDTENEYLAIVDRTEETFLRYPNVQQKVVAIPHRILVRAWMQAAVPLLLSREKVDVVHYTKGLSAFLGRTKTVLTIYDMTTLLLPWTQSKIDVAFWRHVQPRVARGAHRIVTGSVDAKKDIQRFYGISEDKIHVAPFAPAPHFRLVQDETSIGQIREKYGLPERFVLFTGILALKKNISTLIRAFSILRPRLPFDCKLVIAGRRYGQSDDRKIYALVHELNLEQDVVFTGAVSDEDLVLLFNAAGVFAFPSLHEGFGIAPVEAMVCGTPVVTTARGSLPEVVGDAGIMVQDPLDAAELAGALEAALRDEGLRKELIARGFEKAKTYSWEKTARETLRAYHLALGSRHAGLSR